MGIVIKKWNGVPNMKRKSMLYFKFANSLSRGLSILERFTSDKHHFSLSEISKIDNIAKSTTFRLLKTFSELQYLI